ncbi:glutamate-cysteine ligase family protein [Actinoplanes missouriensis]|uniref:glutamate-cysteine ligase family protein n=1 Tax=Actinoplanes missouriensis TaxID=1866 RepID=UPI0003026B6A|nr:glutamate-cysteine ligase family protein [Actinoplanes missouriensis]
MIALTEKAAADLLAAEAFSPGLPGFVGIAVDLLLDPASAPSGRRPLRHGFLDARSPRVMVVSGPPSPGLEVALRRMADDTAASTRLVEKHRLTVLDQATDTVHPDGPQHALGTATAGIRIGLEPGLDGGGPLGLGRRWNLAHTLTPVLAAAFANAPLRHGRPTGWRSVRQALRRELPVAPPPGEARESWAASVLRGRTATGRSLRDALHAGARLTARDLHRHRDALRPPVAARGHLELDVADRQPGSGWRLPVTVATVLMDDPRAAEEAWEATKHLVDEAELWERAARDAMTDPVLAAAARDCFVAAYGALARQGTGRELRDAVAEFTERYVHRGRCPADDILDQVTAHS